MSGFLCSMVGATYTAAGRSAITTVGNAQVDTAQSKFGGASAQFDGTGDYLEVGVSGDFAFGTGNFTIEAFIRNTKASSTRKSGIFSKRNFDNINAGGWGLYLTTDDGKIGWEQLFSGGTNYEISTTISANTWYHVAVVRNGTAMNIYIDGTSRASWTDSTNYTNTNQLKIGTFWDSTQSNTPTDSVAFQGHIDEMRISSVARYTAAFTAPTSAFVNDANTLLLIHADGTDASTVFTDDNAGLGRTAKTLTANGNAQVDTAQSQFGGASALFDTSADWLAITNTDDLNTGTGDFTIEFWMRPTSRATSFPVVIQNREFDAGCIQITDRHNTNSLKLQLWVVNYSNSTPMISSSTTITNGTWFHIAVSRSGSSWRLFVNGTQEGSTITYSGDATAGIANRTTIGNDAVNTAATQWNGHIDEVRWSNIARYTGNFTTATAPFVNDANTLLLIHANGADASTVFTDDNS
jgi:hypothetical protein